MDLSVSIICFRCPIPLLEATHLCLGATPLSSPQATPHPQELHPILEDLPSRYVGSRYVGSRALDANAMQYVNEDMFATLHMMKTILKVIVIVGTSPFEYFVTVANWVIC